MGAAAPVCKLVVDPSGAATTRTLSEPAWRTWPERNREAGRQEFVPLLSDWGRSVARANLSQVTGMLRLRLTLADRQWLRARMATLRGGTTLRVFPDSTVAGTYTDVVLDGPRPVERYERIDERIDDWWDISLPVLVTSEVGY